MRQKAFEAIIKVQNRHIERLERMVEQLFNVSQKESERMVQLVDEPISTFDADKDKSFDPMAGSMINDS